MGACGFRCYGVGMGRELWVTVRLDGDERAALGRLAAAEDRPVSVMARRLIVAGLSARQLVVGGAELVQAAVEAGAVTFAGSDPAGAASAGQHPFAPGGPSGRCAAAGCGERKFAGVHSV